MQGQTDSLTTERLYISSLLVLGFWNVKTMQKIMGRESLEVSDLTFASYFMVLPIYVDFADLGTAE